MSDEILDVKVDLKQFNKWLDGELEKAKHPKRILFIIGNRAVRSVKTNISAKGRPTRWSGLNAEYAKQVGRTKTSLKMLCASIFCTADDLGVTISTAKFPYARGV